MDERRGAWGGTGAGAPCGGKALAEYGNASHERNYDARDQCAGLHPNEHERAVDAGSAWDQGRWRMGAGNGAGIPRAACAGGSGRCGGDQADICLAAQRGTGGQAYGGDQRSERKKSGGLRHAAGNGRGNEDHVGKEADWSALQHNAEGNPGSGGRTCTEHEYPGGNQPGLRPGNRRKGSGVAWL